MVITGVPPDRRRPAGSAVARQADYRFQVMVRLRQRRVRYASAVDGSRQTTLADEDEQADGTAPELPGVMSNRGEIRNEPPGERRGVTGDQGSAWAPWMAI